MDSLSGRWNESIGVWFVNDIWFEIRLDIKLDTSDVSNNMKYITKLETLISISQYVTSLLLKINCNIFIFTEDQINSTEIKLISLIFG